MGQGQSDSDEEVKVSQIHSLYAAFMKECPSGALHLHEFRRIFVVQSSSEDEALYMETLFQLFDRNKSGYIIGRDENGKLDKNEVTHIIKIICKIKNKNTGMTPDEVCDRIFELVDLNKDGQISLSEFMEGAQRDAWIMDLLKHDVGASGWFRENWKKKI